MRLRGRGPGCRVYLPWDRVCCSRAARQVVPRGNVMTRSNDKLPLPHNKPAIEKERGGCRVAAHAARERVVAIGSAVPAPLALTRRCGARRRSRWLTAGMTLLGHQLHRAPGEPLVHPVVAGVEQRAEVADLLAKRQDLVGHRVRRAVDHQLLDDGRDDRARRPAGPGAVLNRLARPAAFSLLEQRAIVEVIRAVRIGRVAPGGRRRRRRRRCSWPPASSWGRRCGRPARSPRRSSASGS